MKRKTQNIWCLILPLFYALLPTQIESSCCHSAKSKDGYPMPMYFSNNINIKFLFDFLQVKDEYEFVLCNIVCILLGFLCVYVKVLKKKAFMKDSNALKTRMGMLSTLFFSRSAVYGWLSFLNYTIDFLLMLIVMTFNVFIFLSTIFGVACGYLFYGHRLAL
ncbi:copper transporter, putative [Plasmodium knowlesi strain H]|uniref:Copper transport protein n=3 Tax=Plasmodium knowlesi TaxID=5850 RepID=A0A5K1UPZ8_PLAKH|nr:copper transporter, putative [Plasmodium knowlesi strain H]OTN67824.1 Copper transporter domain containing protein [Plasmodium knowlesi]CAA9990392.1 copper transporter, putative [Plasmodium knowlesi strain H]SBO19598.1 copper transporter, putative [Plasmodium knowlesi strain H]SBO22631.1 copper transporter, putative [Plasmodium knowlesi strain H]VVS79866.1 copper transporter, putative [Plasmodium knowlesi strain H]|eukprot:XP_002260792.1 copper transporter domain containing protein [Plasmodium knowlesi strain H]